VGDNIGTVAPAAANAAVNSTSFVIAAIENIVGLSISWVLLFFIPLIIFFFRTTTLLCCC
jgi:hypothetical protein